MFFMVNQQMGAIEKEKTRPALSFALHLNAKLPLRLVM